MSIPKLVHRDDLQGLRGVAVLLVVLDHAGVPFLQGGFVGVDAFFVLSGFLITGLLLSQTARRGHVPLVEFYVRRARRILPAAVLTLVVADIAAFELLNFVRAKAAVLDSLWASLFAANVHFASQRADYFAQGQPPSPFQNFWTLSVEEQFYLVWPVLLSLALFGGLVARRRRAEAPGITRPALLRALAVIAAAGLASLAWSIYSTETTPVAAYFSTFTRAWELALGAALAIASSRVARLPQYFPVTSGWLGFGCLAVAAVVFSARTPFPGYAALLPALGAALVIGAGIGREQSRLGVGRILALAPLRYVGDRSYALYLWHWPVLIIAIEYSGHALSTGVKLLLVFGALLLSIVSYAVFENPIRQMKWRAPVGLVLWPSSVALVLAVAMPILSAIGRTTARIEAASAAVHPAALRDPLVARAPARSARSGGLPAVRAAVRAAERRAPLPSALVPAVSNLHGDRYTLPAGCWAKQGQTSSRICRFGVASGRKTLVIMGDSHARMWMPAVLAMARRDGWAVTPFVKPRCVPRTWTASSGQCRGWYRWARRRASALHPYATLIVGSWSGTSAPRLAVKPVASLAKAMNRSSAAVIVMGDAPTQRRDPVDCLLAPGSTMKSCTAKATKSQLRTDATIASNSRKHGVGFISTRGWFCARPRAKSIEVLCPLVINQTITWSDRGHISQTYSLELKSVFRAAFRHQLFR